MTTSAALSVAPTSSTARKTNCSSLAASSWAGCSVVAMGLLLGWLTAATLGAAERTSHQGGHLVFWCNRAMLVGRHRERQALDRLIADARSGRSGVLALVGEAGIGKTALLDYAAGSAAGFRLLRARGIESEAQVPFAGLLELLRPALGALERIPAPQR